MCSLLSHVFGRPVSELKHSCRYHCYIAKGLQSTNLRQLVIALVADLGLNKPTHGNDRRTIAFDESRRDYGFTEEKGFMANDECRALLACFCVST